jgi:hypothetical protein
MSRLGCQPCFDGSQFALQVKTKRAAVLGFLLQCIVDLHDTERVPHVFLLGVSFQSSFRLPSSNCCFLCEPSGTVELM